MPDATHGATKGRILTAFAALYIIWGSTYLAIRFAIETIPPFLMAGTRFVLSGLILCGIAFARVKWRPSAREWRAAALIGGLLLMGGNGAVVWAEQRVPSGVAALLVATVPLWMVLLDWLRPGGKRPPLGVGVGLLLGLVGLGLLVGLDDLRGNGGVDLIGAAVLTIGSMSWAAGSIASKRVPLPKDPLAATGLEMLCGGALLLTLGTVTGELRGFHPGAVTAHSLTALLYLTTFGSLIGFTAYIWLLRVVAPAKVSTYAYVNPVVAVLLGWALAGEPLTTRMLVAAAVIVAAVATITIAGSRAASPPPPRTEPRPEPLPDESTLADRRPSRPRRERVG